MKLKDTLRLPKTAFPMKAALPVREPERLARWEDADIYGQLARARAGRPKYVLHDGPPYANGHVHLGTALNKLLKDFVVKARAQAGFDTPYVPGWDCHGMPIEHQVLQHARQEGETLDQAAVRARCRAYAEEFIDVQRAEFRRLGVFGLWERPYLTMDPEYEAAIVGAFGSLHERGYIYKGLRSIHWCPTCRTALANAEVEYDDEHESTTIHVRFPVVAGEKASSLGVPDGAAVLIWTTTPWTIPANVATAVHAELEYVLVGGDAREAIVARALLPRVAEELGWKDAPVLAGWTGRDLEGLPTRHPLFPRDSPVVLADHVTTEAGTGAVHTAPGHGAEDFETGQRLGLPILVPVDKGGIFTEEAGAFAGKHVFDANDDVVDALRDAGALVQAGSVVHSYPTCWRCHRPLIFLATDQWFLRADHAELRQACLKEVDAATWYPAWGHDRMYDSVSSRPDWCLSRQRAWGVPIPAFSCADCGEPIVNAAVVEAVRQQVAMEGADVWYERSASELAPPGTACGACGGTRLEKDANILDVWFDASCSHLGVLLGGRWPELEWPADLYLEAVDQHRGWFQVSLLNGVALRGKAPFRAVLTHGLVLDEHARKMSKSLGNVISPEDILAQHGADVLRLFYASVDSTVDFRFSLSLLEPIVDAYRKIRNTWRFLLGNLADFDPERDAVPHERLLEVDRHALDRLAEVSAEAREAYDVFAFNRVYRTLLVYLTTDVSAFHAHAMKDRLYCEEPTGHRRRSGQTVLFEIARESCQLLAPILAFTADEAWESLPAWSDKPASVHLAEWPDLRARDEALAVVWRGVHSVRHEVLKAIERARAEGRVKDPLEAVVRVCPPEAQAAALEERTATLPEVFVVADVELVDPGTEAPDGAHVAERLEKCWVEVRRSGEPKCPRCWIRRATSSRLTSHPEACDRCAAVVQALGVELDPA